MRENLNKTTTKKEKKRRRKKKKEGRIEATKEVNLRSGRTERQTVGSRLADAGIDWVGAVSSQSDERGFFRKPWRQRTPR